MPWREGPPTPRGGAIKKTLRHIIIFAVIVGALYLLLPRLVDTQQTLDYISGASYVLLVLAVVLEVAALLGYANLFRYVLRVLDIRMRLREVLAITLSSLAMSHILSAGGVGGWVVTYNSLMKQRVPHGIIFVAVAAQQFFNYVVLWFFFALALVYLIIVRGSDSVFGYLVGVVLIALILWLPIYAVYLYNHPTRLRVRVAQLARLVNRVMRREVVKERHIDGWIDNLLIGMRRMTSHRGSFRNTLFLACAFWFFDMLCLWCTFAAFGYTIGLGHLLVGYVIAYSIGTLAPTPGGLGAVEGIMIALYASFGVPSAVAVAVVLIYRIINFWLPILPGFIAYAIVRPGRRLVAEGEVEAAADEAPAELSGRGR
ncbi:MAG: flippase-like domain-containing protein [Thermoleophilia bacterium]|nr:flippase-like domain-containing protein [Thermoleophilia bacterium]